MKKGLALVLLSLTLTAGTLYCSTLRLKLAENQPKGNPITEGMEKFAELVKEKTNGSVEIEVYTDAQLGDEASTIEQIEMGTLDFARVNTSALAATVDEVGVFTLPYVFTSTEHKYRVLDGKVGDSVMKSLENYGMIGLKFWEAGSRNFYTTTKPITSVEDMRGLKIRVQQSETAIRMIELLGARATPMAYGEVFQGLQTGIVDGAENDFVSYYTSGHYEVAKHFTLDAHMAPPAILLVSKRTWDNLNDDQKKAINESAEEAVVWQRQAMQDFQNESRKAVEEAGTIVYDVNIAEFQETVKSIYDAYPQYKDMLSEMEALQ